MGDQQANLQERFTSQNVRTAYQPSGRTTPVAVALMVGVVALAAPIAGSLIALVDMAVSAIGLFAYEFGDFAGYTVVFVTFAVYFIAGTLMGRALARGVGWAGRTGKNRSQWLAWTFGLLAGVGAVGAFYLIRRADLGAEAFDSWVDWAKLGLYGSGLIFTAGDDAARKVYQEPFCEECNRFMETREIASLDLSADEALLQVMRDHDWAAISALPEQPDHRVDRSALVLDSCPECRAEGFVSVVTQLVRRSFDDDGNETTEHASRRTFSEAVGAGDQQAIVQLESPTGDHGAMPVTAVAEPEPEPDVTVAADFRVAPPTALEEALMCWTCGKRAAETTQALPVTCPPGKGHAGRVDELRELGYLDGKTLVVPRCEACFTAERRIATAGQTAAWVGIPTGIGTGILVANLASSGIVGAVVGVLAFLAVAVVIMRRAARSPEEDVNTVRAEHPASAVLKAAGWTVGAAIIPKRGPAVSSLRHFNFSQTTESVPSPM